jgi:Zn-finger domain-containing protein
MVKTKSRINIVMDLNESGEVVNKLEELGIKKITSYMYGKQLEKRYGGFWYYTFIEVVKLENGRKGWRISLHVDVTNEQLLIRLAEKFRDILNELKAEGYSESST